MAGRLIYDEGRGEGCVGWAGARRPAFVGRFSDRAATGPHHPPCRARAVPRARPAAQARPGVSGRASTGTVATGPGRTRAGPKQRATGRAGGPRAAWPTIHTSHLPAANHYATSGAAAALRPHTSASGCTAPPQDDAHVPPHPRRSLVAASRGHRRWSLLPPQENGVGSIPSSVPHWDDLSSLLGCRFVALSRLLHTSASSPLTTSLRRRSVRGWSIPCVARRFLNF